MQYFARATDSGQADGQTERQTDHADCRGELRKVQMCMHILHVYHDPTQNKSLRRHVTVESLYGHHYMSVLVQY